MSTDDILAQLDTVIVGASSAERAALVIQLAARLAALGAGLTESRGQGSPEPATADSTLDVEGAAERLGVSKTFLYRNAATLPFSVRFGRRLRFSVRGIDRYIMGRHRV